MWITSVEGFYSAVLWDDGRVCVRGRVKADLQAFVKHVPNRKVKVVETKSSDYRFRVWVSREEWAVAMASLALTVEYPNFKSAVAKVDPERARVYERVWSIIGGIQKGGPWGMHSWRDRWRPGRQERLVLDIGSDDLLGPGESPWDDLLSDDERERLWGDEPLDIDGERWEDREARGDYDDAYDLALRPEDVIDLGVFGSYDASPVDPRFID